MRRALGLPLGLGSRQHGIVGFDKESFDADRWKSYNRLGILCPHDVRQIQIIF